MSSPRLNILIIRFSSIGDILLTTPFVHQLRAHFPEAYIRYVTKNKFSVLLTHNPAIDEVIPFNDQSGVAGIRELAARLSSVTFDYVFDLHNNQRSHLLTGGLKHRSLTRLQKHRVRRAAYVYLKRRVTMRPVALRYMDCGKEVPLPDNGEGLELFIPNEIVQDAKQHLNGFDQTSYICLAPGAGFATKIWPSDHWEKLAQKILKTSKRNLLIVGGATDRDRIRIEHPQLLNLAGQLSLLESAAVIKTSKGIICNDSGLMHMAAAVATPIVAIFGSTTPELGFAPFRAKAKIIQGAQLWCRPCSHMGRKSCPLGNHKCMQDIDVDEVLRALTDMLSPGLD